MAITSDMPDMHGLTAVITGGSSGIGYAVARLFTQQGAQVVLVGRQLVTLNEAARSLACDVSQVHCITGDVSSEGYANKIIFDTRKRFGAVNILINCAGAFRGGSILKMSEEDFDHVTDVNLKATWFMCKFAARAMLENGGGAIVNVASIMAAHGSKEIHASAYAASKGGVIALTNALALELAPQIRVNCVVPGAVHSPMYNLMNHFTESAESLKSRISSPDLSTEELERALSNIATETRPLASPTIAGDISDEIATVDEVAEAIIALSDPRSEWVTGEKIIIGG